MLYLIIISMPVSFGLSYWLATRGMPRLATITLSIGTSVLIGVLSYTLIKLIELF